MQLIVCSVGLQMVVLVVVVLLAQDSYSCRSLFTFEVVGSLMIAVVEIFNLY